MVDWTKPLEAVNDETGAVVPVTLGHVRGWDNPDSGGDYHTLEDFNGRNGIWHSDGTSWGGVNGPWRIRNKATEWPPEATPELWAEMVAALERSAQGWENVVELELVPSQHVMSAKILADELRAILTKINPPVESLREAVRQAFMHIGLPAIPCDVDELTEELRKRGVGVVA